MKKEIKMTVLVLFAMSSMFNLSAQELGATDIVRTADEKFNGEKSSYSVMSMKVIRPEWQRTIEFRSWTLGRDFALTLITAPAKEKAPVKVSAPAKEKATVKAPAKETKKPAVKKEAKGKKQAKAEEPAKKK